MWTRTLSRALVLALVLLVSGCWLQPGFGPARQNSNPFERGITEASVANLAPAWSVPSDLGSSGQPLATRNRVFHGGVRTVGGQRMFTVRAVDRSSGAVVWERDLYDVSDLSSSAAMLAVADDEVLTAGGGPSRFDRLDAATGATIETVQTTDIVDANSIAVNGSLIAHRAYNFSENVFSLVVRNRDTFEVMWTASTQRFTLGSGPLLIADGRIYLQDGCISSCRMQDTEGAGAPVVSAYPAKGCGAESCEPTMTAPVPLPDLWFDYLTVRLLAVTNDGDLLLERTWGQDRSGLHRDDLVALTSNGTHDWTLSLQGLGGVAVSDDTVFAVGRDESNGPTLFARSDSSMWRVDGGSGLGDPMVAGGLVYVGSGNDILVYSAGGCGAPSCDGEEVAVIDTGPGTGGIYGMSVSLGTLFVNKAGPDGQLIAYTPAS